MSIPKPYYDHAGIVIYNADCREILPHLPPVDLVLTDPPYGDTSLEWDAIVDGWTRHIPADSMWLFGSLRFHFFIQADLQATGWRLAQDLVWEKHNGSNFHADRFRRVHEHIAHWYRGEWASVHKAPVMTEDAAPRTVRRKQRPPHTGDIGVGVYTSEDGGPRLMRSVIQARSCHGYAVHPTQKPVEIVDPLIRYSCPLGGLILDPFMGSGTTLVAAKQLGRRCIGVEIEEKYCAIAAERLRQQVLDFGPAPEPAGVQESLFGGDGA